MIAWAIILGGFFLPPHGATGKVPLCPSRLVMGVPCPGCGLTRSVTCLAHGEFEWSWRYHPFGVVALLFAIWYALVPLAMPRLHHAATSSRTVKRLGLVLLVVFILYGIVRAILWGAGYDVPAAH